MAVTYLSDSLRTALQTKLSTTTIRTMSDLRKAHYGGKVSQQDAVRSYLQANAPSTLQSLPDLWRSFLVAKGVSRIGSLGDMQKTFFTTIGF